MQLITYMPCRCIDSLRQLRNADEGDLYSTLRYQRMYICGTLTRIFTCGRVAQYSQDLGSLLNVWYHCNLTHGEYTKTHRVARGSLMMLETKRSSSSSPYCREGAAYHGANIFYKIQPRITGSGDEKSRAVHLFNEMWQGGTGRIELKDNIEYQHLLTKPLISCQFGKLYFVQYSCKFYFLREPWR